MGCGSSKAAEVKQTTVEAAPSSAAPTATKVDVSQSNKSVAQAEGDKNDTSTQQAQQDSAQAKPDTKKDEAAASQGMNTDADLSVTGRKIESRAGSRDQQNPPDTPATDDDYSRMTSAISTRSAPPSIMERPSSRGGRAFEISFEDGDVRRAPRRLQKLQHSSRRRKGDLTLDQLQRKLEAAEKRKKEYEKRILEKISVDTRKPADRREEQTEQQAKEVEKKVEKKVDKAMENREAHLRSLREKLRAREEHGRKVREKKQQQKTDQSEA
ncbi:hypothetical protein PTSG_10513 [Salpingoeca rosetta]|uniref:Stathmin n=1 Tax=Salpingoeca rosetta (strain ATCC 50818 / BSB-021) TaxID=946362 RepID=F2UPV8_SALR5|nr:uncharacterized protein PTSG_10513 [Salpingoeca rosetta]EGD79663.1 hypothetical protein PTSG_10513 [Salpingoeca rosetta]|eukprot:XP_004988891.1 hypothetical protein PTSG_10513 [Salpingoeca rosetta]